LTARYLTDYASGGAADPTSNGFDAGSPALIKSAIDSATAGWELSGNGSAEFHTVKGGGTAFPSGPATGDRFFRTDLVMEFYYNGTRWLSTQLFTLPIGGSKTSSISATENNNTWATANLHGGSDWWLEKMSAGFIVLSGGTALGASHKWTIELGARGNATTNDTTKGSISIASGTSNVNRQSETAIGALLRNGTDNVAFQCRVVKTGTPGAILYGAELTYRVVAT
jgi:hypothetical protein